MLFSLYAARPFLMFSSITSLKMIVAPALLSALAISKPIPYDAPVTKAFLPLRENILMKSIKTPIVKNLSVIAGLRFPQEF